MEQKLSEAVLDARLMGMEFEEMAQLLRILWEE